MTIFASLALPVKTKRTVLVQEAIRILSRCHESLPWSTKAAHLTNLNARMLQSGYTAPFRATDIKSALNAFNNIKERAESGVRPIHRPDEVDRVKRAEDRIWKGTTWFKAGTGSPGCQDDRQPGKPSQGQGS